MTMTAESHNTNEMYLKMKRVSLSAPYIDLDALKLQSSQLLSKTASYLNKATDHYQTQLQQRRARLDALNETNKAKREAISKRRAESEHYDSVWKKIQAMEQQIKVTEVKLATLQQKQNLRKQMALHSQRTSAQLRQNLAVCEKLTGMTVHAIEDNHLKVDFTLIDEREPDKVFSFVVHLLEEHVYKVVQCDPMIPDLPELTESLNRHGDFSSFIKRIRREFCNLALSSSPQSPQTPPDLTTLPNPINT